MAQTTPYSNTWTEVLEYGDKEERRIVDWLNTHLPEYKAQWCETHNISDINTIRGGIEVKSYRMPYRIPSIESLCVQSGKPSVWLSDTNCKYIFCNHGYHIHVYDAEKMRQIYKKGWMLKTYNANVNQGDGSKKTMEFISVVSRSSDQRDIYLETDDATRWDCNMLDEWSPYILTLKKDWSSFV